MIHYPDPRQRARFVAGLRALADFIESRPDVPVPRSADMFVFPPGGNDVERRAEIDSIADRIGAEGHFAHGGHYIASRLFGPVEYHAVAIPHNDDSDNEQSE